jgi:hypothetical protein
MKLLKTLSQLSVCVALVLSAQLVSAQALTKVERPAGVTKQMAERGEQDKALPAIKIISPKPNEVIKGDSAPLKLELSGDLKGYHPHKDPTTGMGNHIHVILDNNAYEAYYDIGTPFTVPNLSPGEHTIRVFASRPWHESYKNSNAFAIVKFSVVNSQPKAAQRVAVNAGKPLLTYSRPKGEYKGAAADPIMIDFWLANAKLKGDGGKLQVRCTVDGQTMMLDRWEPIWLSGWTSGKHTIQLELLNAKGQVVDNGGYNTTTREITVVK